MIDAHLRTVIDPILNRMALYLRDTSITANQVSIGGFLIGVGAVPVLAAGHYTIALGLILINRLFDGLDGALARQRGVSDFGGFLDIVLDFIFYSAVIFGFALGNPTDAVYAAFLIFSFIGTGSSFLAYSALAAKQGLTTEFRGLKSIYYLGGLTEGFETIVCFVLMCLMPSYFWLIALIYGILCWLTTLTRIWVASKTLR